MFEPANLTYADLPALLDAAFSPAEVVYDGAMRVYTRALAAMNPATVVTLDRTNIDRWIRVVQKRPGAYRVRRLWNRAGL